MPKGAPVNGYGKYAKLDDTEAVYAEILKEGDVITSPSGFTWQVLRRLNPSEGRVIKLEGVDMGGKVSTREYQNRSTIIVKKEQ